MLRNAVPAALEARACRCTSPSHVNSINMSRQTDDTKQPLLYNELSDVTGESRPNAPDGHGIQVDHLGAFKECIGEVPLREPNVQNEEDIARFINGEDGFEAANYCCVGACCLTGIGCLWVLAKSVLIRQGELGFTMSSGKPGLLPPGRHVLISPLTSLVGKRSSGDDVIQIGPVSIIRVDYGNLGFALNNAKPEILLPGLHARNSAAFKFKFLRSTGDELIQFGPIKIITVKSGTVRVCYNNGRVVIYREGRYMANSGTFVVGGSVNIQQQNMRFSKHPVLLDGGISMLVEGLLTYQVVDVANLIHELGEKDLVHSLEDVTKAEIARVFASLHLEQISSATTGQGEPLGSQDEKAPTGMLGTENKDSPASDEGQTRMWICQQVIKYITPIVKAWGVKIINFQLESTKIADDNYAKEYEAASLGMAKAKANLRAVAAENEVKLQAARALAMAKRIEAEGKKQAMILVAEGEAKARLIDAEARNQAAEVMHDPFAKEYALGGLQVAAIKELKATSLTVIPDSGLGQLLATQASFNSQRK